MATQRRATPSFPRAWSPNQIPNWPVELDPGHPLFASCIRYWLLNSGSVPCDLVTGAPSSLYSAGLPHLGGSIGPEGPVLTWPTPVSGSPCGLTVGSGPILGGLPAWSIVARVRSLSTVALDGAMIYSERAASGNDVIYLRGMSGSPSYCDVVYRNDGGTLFGGAETSGQINDGLVHTVAATFTGTAFNVYLDGTLTYTGSWSSNQNFTNSGIVCAIGWTEQDGSAIWGGDIAQVILFDAALSQQQVALLSMQPYGMLRPAVRREYYAAAALPVSLVAVSAAAGAGVFSSAIGGGFGAVSAFGVAAAFKSSHRYPSAPSRRRPPPKPSPSRGAHRHRLAPLRHRERQSLSRCPPAPCPRRRRPWLAPQKPSPHRSASQRVLQAHPVQRQALPPRAPPACPSGPPVQPPRPRPSRRPSVRNSVRRLPRARSRR